MLPSMIVREEEYQNGVYGTSIAHDNVFGCGVIQCMYNMSRVTINLSLGFQTTLVLRKSDCLAKEDT